VSNRAVVGGIPLAVASGMLSHLSPSKSDPTLVPRSTAGRRPWPRRATATLQQGEGEPVRLRVVEAEGTAPEAGDLAGETASDVGVDDRSTLGLYLRSLRQHPLMTREQEHEVAVRLSRTGEPALVARLVRANLRLVVKIALEYRGAHNELLDLIQEGNIGLIHAVEKYDPFRDVKLSTYASWWIRAYILRFILANWCLVRVGTTQIQRKLFFNLRKERTKLEKQGIEVNPKHLATVLGVSEKAVVEMEPRLNAFETSLDAPLRADDPGKRTRGDFVPAAAASRPDVRVEANELEGVMKRTVQVFGTTLRDRDLEIFRARLVSEEPVTLNQLAQRFGVTRERVRQLEQRLKERLRLHVTTKSGDAIRLEDLLE
jgi:RNA polymerase sigma-32 factor